MYERLRERREDDTGIMNNNVMSGDNIKDL